VFLFADDITDTSVVQNGDASDDPCTVNQIEEVADFEKTPHDAFEKCATCNVFTLPHVHCVTCKKTFQTHAGLAGHQKRQKHWGEHCFFILVYRANSLNFNIRVCTVFKYVAVSQLCLLVSFCVK